MVLSVLVAVSVPVADAAGTTPTLTLKDFDETILVSGKNLAAAADVDVLATVKNGKGQARVKTTNSGRVLMGFSTPAGFSGVVNVVLTSGSTKLTKAISIEADPENSVTTTTKGPASTTTTATPTTPTSTPTTPTTKVTPTTVKAGPATKGVVPLIGKSGMAWNSIVFGHGSNPQGFESWRKRPVDGVLIFPTRSSWEAMGQLPSRRAGDLMVYSIPTFPEGMGGSNAKVAAGQYDSQITALANKMKSAGWTDKKTVIRLGWENNGNWYEWSWNRGTPEDYAAAYRKWVTLFRAAGLNVAWDWNLNKGTQAYNSGYSWTKAYPGDAYVDVIGLDAYDFWTPSFTDAQWKANIESKNPGLQEVADFARAHKKQMAVDEWGVVNDSTPGAAGGDNPFYIAKMFEFLKANADIMAWDNTYDDNGAPARFKHKLSAGDNPKAAAQYLKPYPSGWGG